MQEGGGREPTWAMELDTQLTTPVATVLARGRDELGLLRHGSWRDGGRADVDLVMLLGS